MKINDIRNYEKQGKAIIIFGAGIVGEVVEYVLSSQKIPVYCFCDNNEAKIGGRLHDKPVKALQEIKDKGLDALFVVAISIHREIEIQLNDFGYSLITNSRELVGEIDITKYDFSVSHYQVKEYIESYMRHTAEYIVEEDNIIIKNIGLIITERCSLKCRDCINLMQYFKEPKHIDSDINLSSMEKLLENVSCIERVSVVGGEPFVNTEVYSTIEWLVKQEKVKNVTIFTNATVIPDDEQIKSLKNNKVFVSISNYEVKNQKVTELSEKMKEHGIDYNIVNERIWKDLGNLQCRNRADDENNTLFHKCIFDGCFQLMYGQLHYCARSACGVALKAFPVKEGDYFDLFRTDLSPKEYKAKFIDFLNNKSSAPTACAYCSGKDWKSKHIPVGIQTKQVLDFNGQPILS